MARKISKDTDDKKAGIRFHISSARMSIQKVSYVAFQRWLDEMERSMFLCVDCGWRGRGSDLTPMEADDDEVYSIEHEGDTWYACPKCESEIPVERPVMKLSKP